MSKGWVGTQPWVPFNKLIQQQRKKKTGKKERKKKRKRDTTPSWCGWRKDYKKSSHVGQDPVAVGSAVYINVEREGWEGFFLGCHRHKTHAMLYAVYQRLYYLSREERWQFSFFFFKLLIVVSKLSIIIFLVHCLYDNFLEFKFYTIN